MSCQSEHKSAPSQKAGSCRKHARARKQMATIDMLLLRLQIRQATKASTATAEHRTATLAAMAKAQSDGAEGGK